MENINFNSDCSYFAVCFRNSFEIYSSLYVYCVFKGEIPDCTMIYQIEIINKSNLIAVLIDSGKNDKQNFVIYDMSKKQIIMQFQQNNEIKSFKVNEKYLYLFAKTHVFCFSLLNLELVEEFDILDYCNIYSINITGDTRILAFKQSDRNILIRINSDKCKQIENAHKEPIKMINLNLNGTLIASCSFHGKKIRIFSCITLSKLIELNMDYQKNIVLINFSPDNKLFSIFSESKISLFEIKLENEAIASNNLDILDIDHKRSFITKVKEKFTELKEFKSIDCSKFQDQGNCLLGYSKNFLLCKNLLMKVLCKRFILIQDLENENKMNESEIIQINKK